MSWWNPLAWGGGEQGQGASLWGGAGTSTGMVSDLAGDVMGTASDSLGMGGLGLDTVMGGLGAAGSGVAGGLGAGLAGLASGAVADVAGAGISAVGNLTETLGKGSAGADSFKLW